MTRPLEGIRILDLSIALTGPYAVTLLADQGAEVIKVERPGIGDIARWVGVMVNGMSALYLMCNRGKRSIAVDIHTEGGVAIVKDLAARADVVIQNFRPGVLDRLGLGYEAIREVNPEVVYASLSGFGSEGPYRDRRRVRHGDSGLRRAGDEPGRSRRRRAGVPTPNGGRQGHRPVRLAGHHRGLARPGHGKGRAARRAGHDGCRGIVPVGRLRRQRGAPRLRPFAELEFRGRLPTDAVQRRVGCGHAYLCRRLHRHVQGPGRRGMGRPAGGHPRGSQQEPGCDRRPGGPVLRPRGEHDDGRSHVAPGGRARALRHGPLAGRADRAIRMRSQWAFSKNVSTTWSGAPASPAIPSSSSGRRPTPRTPPRPWASTPTRS